MKVVILIDIGNGVMYSCILYDRALTGGEVNYVFNKLPRPNLILAEKLYT